MKSPELSKPRPYDQPIFRWAYGASSPDARLRAEIERAEEVSMSNPTLGRLEVSDGLVLERCSPSFVWSADSRYLAVAQHHPWLGLFHGMHVLVADTRARAVYASRRIRAWLQPESFTAGELVVRADPCGKQPWELRWRIPGQLGSFERLASYGLNDRVGGRERR